MTRQEKYQEGVELAWAELEEAEERRRMAGLDFEPVTERPTIAHSVCGARRRLSYVVNLITQPGKRKTRFCVQAFDKDHAEFMALAQLVLKNGEVAYINEPLR